LIAAATERIRVGSGAVQLTNTRPLLVAEQFGTIAQLCPDRVDLGLGRFDPVKIMRKRAGGDAVIVRAPAAQDRMVDGVLVPAPARLRGDIRTVELLGRLLGYRLDEPAATQIVGSPATVVARLRALAHATGADELLVTTITHDHADRLRSHDLLARAWHGQQR
jgi:alkanesulfonate monooxygenase SsuD/methylene tetrahydromethanopterin reductase-like flavin-dependent oxidoreductase (luciferase family)